MLKGDLPIKWIAVLALGILITALLATITLRVDGEVIRPGINNITEKLDEYQTPTVRIGDNGVTQDEAKKEFRGLVTYNMLTAANCNLVPLTTNGLNGGGTDVEHFEGFDAAVDGLDYEFTNDCVQEIIPDGPLEVIPFNNIEESSDLEGRQGRLNFNISQSFTISRERLMKANFDDSVAGGEGFPIVNDRPDFWNGNRVAAFVPDGIRGISMVSDESEYERFYDSEGDLDGDFTTNWILEDGNAPPYSKIYYYRVRMNGIPTIIEYDDFKDYDGFQSFERFVKDARYQFCEGAEGTIQSNAKYIDFGGEAQGDKSAKENAVYPEVQITEGSRSCLSDLVHDSDYNGRDFIDYSIGGEKCTYHDLGDRYNSGKTSVGYSCMLMEDSTSFPGYTGQVDFLKTGWKADQNTCELDPDDITDLQPTNLETNNGNPSEKIVQSFEEYRPPYSFSTEVTLSHPDDNGRPGELYFDLPNDISTEVVVIDMKDSLSPLANDKRVEIDVLNTDGGVTDRYDSISIESGENSESFRISYEGSTLTVRHIGSGNSISMNLQPDKPGQRNIIEGEPEQFSMWINDPGATELNQEMSLDVEETVVEAYPLGCVPEAMN